MRTISTPLKNAFKAGNRATIIKIVTKGAVTYGYTDYDRDLVVSGTTYKCAPGLSRPTMTATSDGQVSNQEFTSSWIDAPETDLLAGKFDNASVEIAFCDPTDVSQGKYIFDKGVLGVIQWTADGFRADMQSHMRELTRNVNFVYTGGCRHQLFSAFDATHIGACTLTKASYTYSGTVSTIGTQKLVFNYSGIGQAAQWCTGGILTWTTGNNAGLSIEVKDHSATTITVFLPTAANIQTGDTFTITAGCDKTATTCRTKFNNLVNFGGFPHIQSEVQYR